MSIKYDCSIAHERLQTISDEELNKADELGRTLLFYIIDKYSLCKYVISRMSLNSLMQIDNPAGNTILHYATESNKFKLCELIFDKIFPNLSQKVIDGENWIYRREEYYFLWLKNKEGESIFDIAKRKKYKKLASFYEKNGFLWSFDLTQYLNIRIKNLVKQW